MLVERRVHLVVEVVEKCCDPPELLVLAEPGRVRRRRCLDREGVPKQCLTLRVVGKSGPCLFASRFQAVASIVPSVAATIARPLAESFVIEGGRPLSGRLRASGNKNGALPILAACLLTDEPVQLSNVPRIRDVDTMIGLLQSLGAEVE